MTLPRDWASRTHTFTFQASDWVAIIHTDDLTSNEPIFIRDDGLCFIKRYGNFELAESVPGFVKYERRPWRKRLLDTATLETIEIPLFS
jgi:hypothetical protein